MLGRREAGAAPMKFFEDIQVGDVFEYGRYTFTAENIKSFATRFDPQPFHLDEAAAERSHFGALVASGWHTALAWMRLMVDHRRRMDDAMRVARRTGRRHRSGARLSRTQMAKAGLSR